MNKIEKKTKTTTISIECFALDEHNHTSTTEITMFDKIFRRLILTQSFVSGWGNPIHLQEIYRYRREKIAIRDECLKLVPADSVNENTIEILRHEIKDDRYIISARFRSPLADYLPHLVRESCNQ
jgi:hypothetical protein